MWYLPSNIKVFIAYGHTDMRKSINTLSVLVSEYLHQDPLSGHLYAFCNRRRTIVKILYWDKNGFCLWQKRLEKEKFHWPATEQEVREINAQELRWLLDGLDIVYYRSHSHDKLNYQTVY